MKVSGEQAAMLMTQQPEPFSDMHNVLADKLVKVLSAQPPRYTCWYFTMHTCMIPFPGCVQNLLLELLGLACMLSGSQLHCQCSLASSFIAAAW